MLLAPLDSWLRPPRQVLTLFLGVTTVLSAAMGWFAWQFVVRDREDVAQRTAERVEAASALAETVLRERIDEVGRRLEMLAATDAGVSSMHVPPLTAPGDAAVWVLAGEGRLDIWPRGSLVASPAAALERSSMPLPGAAFTDGEILEHQRHEPAAALARYSRLARSGDGQLRAAALVRLARVQANLGQLDAALRTYGELAALGGTTTELGPPAAAVAQYGRCVVLKLAGRQDELRRQAAAFARDLQGGTWRLTWAEYLSYRDEARAWMGTSQPEATTAAPDDSERLSAAVAALWEEWHTRGAGPAAGSRQVRVDGDVDVTVIWRRVDDRVAALVATPASVGATFVASARAAIQPYRARLILDDAGARVVDREQAGPGAPVSRTLATTSLPWSLRVVDAAPGSDLAAADSRRRLVLGALVVLGLFVVASGAFVVRAVGRETELLRLQTDFVSAVSHEFRTPLTSIAQVNEALVDGRVPESLREDYYRIQLRESQRLQRLVESLLDFGRMESGAHAYRFEPIDASDVAAAIAAEFAARARETGHSVEATLAPDACVSADREALGRAIWNLLDNAVKYSPSNPTIGLRVGERAGHVEIAVRDRGVGVPAADRERIFDTFTRGANAAATGAKGTGLGLAMVRHIARAHGGDVTVDSTPGDGSTFRIVLPAASRGGPGHGGEPRASAVDR